MDYPHGKCPFSREKRIAFYYPKSKNLLPEIKRVIGFYLYEKLPAAEFFRRIIESPGPIHKVFHILRGKKFPCRR